MKSNKIRVIDLIPMRCRVTISSKCTRYATLREAIGYRHKYNLEIKKGINQEEGN
jgi:hypothetical protein